MDRFTSHVVKTSPAADSGSYSGIGADKVTARSELISVSHLSVA